MNRSLAAAGILACLSAACSSPPTAPRAVVPPATRPHPVVDQRPPAAQRSVQRAEDEAATDAWLEKAAREARERNPDRPPEPIQIERVVERQVYADPPSGWYDQYGNPVYGRPAAPRSTFPINTFAGATIGAIAGGCGDSGEAALIGAGIGFVFDLASWQ